MTKSQLKQIFNRLLQEIKNPINKENIARHSHFNYDEYQATIEKYITNIDLIYGANEELKKNIMDKASLLLNFYTNDTVEANIKKFFDAIIFLTTHNPDDYPEHYIDNAIQKKVFDERYDKLVSHLTDQNDDSSTLTLNTIDTNTPFKLFKNSNNSIVVKAGKELGPMSVSKNKLKRVLYNHEDYTYKSYEEVILKKLLDNTIFDLITEKHSAKVHTVDLSGSSKANTKINKLEEERLKTAGKISDLEDTLMSYKEDFDNLNTLYEKSKNVEKDFQSAKESALKDISLQISYKFWAKQATKYNIRYWLYLLATVILSVVLLVGIFKNLENNPFGKNSITTTDKQLVPKVENKKTSPSTTKGANQSSINKQSVAKVVNSKPLPSVEKDSNQSDTDLDKMMKFLHYGFLILLSSMAIWFIRIMMKITLSNYHLSIDANERVIMIRTYLSLIQEGSGYDEKDKKVILDNIFRPTNFGIIKDESSVTVTDIISSFKK